jgi:hypothetical protein
MNLLLGSLLAVGFASAGRDTGALDPFVVFLILGVVFSPFMLILFAAVILDQKVREGLTGHEREIEMLAMKFKHPRPSPSPGKPLQVHNSP